VPHCAALHFAYSTVWPWSVDVDTQYQRTSESSARMSGLHCFHPSPSATASSSVKLNTNLARTVLCPIPSAAERLTHHRLLHKQCHPRSPTRSCFQLTLLYPANTTCHITLVAHTVDWSSESDSAAKGVPVSFGFPQNASIRSHEHNNRH
jgi:hypothetical protein